VERQLWFQINGVATKLARPRVERHRRGVSIILALQELPRGKWKQKKIQQCLKLCFTAHRFEVELCGHAFPNACEADWFRRGVRERERIVAP
jgi:hypothetical protein